MNPDKKKSSSSGGGDSTPKSSHTSKSMKSSKSSSKSRSKSTKADSSKSNGQTPTSSTSSNNSKSNGHTPTSSISSNTPDTPSTPTSSIDSSRDKSNQKGYAAFDPRTIKIIWEQHDTSETDLNPDLLPILAEDASYKMWELIKNIKTYSMHSGGSVTSDLVNEVLKDSDCPPALGPMDIEWDRIDYDGSFFFNSDKIIELRQEYQKDVQITMPLGPPFMTAWPIQSGYRDMMQSFMQSVFVVTLGGSEEDFDTVRQYVYAAPFIGSIYRVLLAKMIQTLAFKQTNHVKLRCWRFMQTLAQHPTCRDVCCREDYFHLEEIFICQLLDTYEATPSDVKIEEKFISIDTDELLSQSVRYIIKLEDIKEEDLIPLADEKPNIKEFGQVDEEVPNTDKVYKLEKDDEGETTAEQLEGIEFSPYIADKVDLDLVDDLCETIGLIGAISDFFNTECMHLILRRLEKFFDGRTTFSLLDYEYINRAIRGLFALGEYAFREFIPFMEKMDILNNDDIPHALICEFARCAIFFRGHDDIFLYEWLSELCADRLLPFMTHYAQFHQKLITYRHLKRRSATFKIVPKVSAKRVFVIDTSFSPAINNTMYQFFPDFAAPIKPKTPIRFRSASCRQIRMNFKPTVNGIQTTGVRTYDLTRDIIIAKRKLFKPLTDEKKCVHLSNYHLLRI